MKSPKEMYTLAKQGQKKRMDEFRTHFHQLVANTIEHGRTSFTVEVGGECNGVDAQELINEMKEAGYKVRWDTNYNGGNDTLAISWDLPS